MSRIWRQTSGWMEEGTACIGVDWHLVNNKTLCKRRERRLQLRSCCQRDKECRTGCLRKDCKFQADKALGTTNRGWGNSCPKDKASLPSCWRMDRMCPGNKVSAYSCHWTDKRCQAGTVLETRDH